MFLFGRRRVSEEDRADLLEYLREVLPLVDRLKEEFDSWMAQSTNDGRHLVFEKDTDGQHAAVYLWRVSEPAKQFVQRDPVKVAQKYYEAFSLVLEARGDAADRFKEAADLAGVHEPAPKVAEANGKLAEADKYMAKASTALRELEGKLGHV